MITIINVRGTAVKEFMETPNFFEPLQFFSKSFTSNVNPVSEKHGSAANTTA
jgi:hypothetical protein